MSTEEPSLARGRAVAAILAGAWRRSPPPLRMTPATLETIVPLLAGSGAGGLSWHRWRTSTTGTTATARELRQHYRLQTLQAVGREEAIRELVPRLRGAGVEPLLIKGWSSACLYPEPGLRPSGDVDLCVADDRLAAAMAALSGPPLPCAVDLHRNVPDLHDRAWDGLFRRSLPAMLGDVVVRVLGPEDQLRLLCLHLARHGMARPLWLCDIGVCLESLPADFDWDYCLWGEKHLLRWIACALGLAHRLLDGPGDVGPVNGDVPPWVERAVLWCWGAGPGRSLRHYLRHPGEVLRRLRYHGISPNHGSMPIKAALQLRLGPNRCLPLVLLQLAAFVRRKIPHVVQRLLSGRRRVSLPFTVHHH
jgi:hypothetical protein